MPTRTRTDPPTAPSADVTVTPTNSPALDDLLVPGPTLPAPDRFFFLHGDDIWMQPSEGQAVRVTDGIAIANWAQTPDGRRLAIAVDNDDGGPSIVWVDGNDLVPRELLSFAGAEGAQAGIATLDWSWDGTRLAVVFDDGSVVLVSNVGGDMTGAPVSTPAGGGMPTVVAWAPSGAGLALLVGQDGDRQSLFVTPIGDSARPVLDPVSTTARSVATLAWLPGRGRIAFVEDADASATRLPGSIFTIAPDGSLLELLVSAGQFAPAARIASIHPSPDGRELAFTVYVPDSSGQPAFESLWVLNIDTGEQRAVPIEPGYRVADVWWTATGLVWRGIDTSDPAPEHGPAYTGSEPFILGRYASDGTSTVIFQSGNEE